MEFLAEFWDFLRQRRKLWLLPLLVMMALFGGLAVIAQATAVGPFLYALF